MRYFDWNDRVWTWWLDVAMKERIETNACRGRGWQEKCLHVMSVRECATGNEADDIVA